MLASKNKYIKSAYEQLRVISQSTEKRLEYEAREKAIRDHNQMMYEARSEGLKQGIEQGIEQGMKQGIKRGMQALILDNLDEGVPKERILSKLQKRFTLTKQQAEQYYQEFTVKE